MTTKDDEEHQVREELDHQEDNEDNTSPEFSFTVALQPRYSSSDIFLSSNSKTKSLSPFAVDLSPADDIFFHGHLLPLQILSHLPISSMNSPDTFSLSKEQFDSIIPQEATKKFSCSSGDNILDENNGIATRNKGMDPRLTLMLSSLVKWRRGSELKGGEKEKKCSQNKRLRFELNRVLRRCANIVKQAAFFRGRNEKAATPQLAREAYCSYSGNLSLRRDVRELRGHRGEYSAPVSTRTSPTNSGLLVPRKMLSSSASNSSVEDLQTAIEAAIAHCKKSCSIDEKHNEIRNLH